MAVDVPAYAVMSGGGGVPTGGYIAQGQPHYGGQALPTIPGGGTPLASLTAEDAAAFLALSSAQRERAGQMTQGELDAAIQKSLARGGEGLLVEGDEAEEDEEEGGNSRRSPPKDPLPLNPLP